MVKLKDLDLYLRSHNEKVLNDFFAVQKGGGGHSEASSRRSTRVLVKAT
jgi:hypothetical protein